MDIDLAGVAVMIAMPVFANIPPSTVKCMLETQMACAKYGVILDLEMNVGSTVFHARSLAAHRFLQSDCNHMFMIDSDMVWRTDDFFRLLALSTRMECVSATYTAKTDPARFYISMTTPGRIVANGYGCVPHEGTGLGFTIVTRKLIQELADRAPKLTFKVNLPGEKVARIFRFDEIDGEARGEDMAFFADVKALGYQPYLDPTVNLGHVGEKEFRAKYMDQLTNAA